MNARTKFKIIVPFLVKQRPSKLAFVAKVMFPLVKQFPFITAPLESEVVPLISQNTRHACVPFVKITFDKAFAWRFPEILMMKQEFVSPWPSKYKSPLIVAEPEIP